MGNRGVLHGAHRALGARRWTTHAWLICRLHFKDRRRIVMAPGRYTELFFLDEATALAAGHRPCFECRRADARAFRTAWIAAHGGDGRAAGIDAALHPARLPPGPRRRTVAAETATLPDGTMVVHPDEPASACLLRAGALLPWSFAGYGAPRRAPARVAVLTPMPTVRVLSAGYAPEVHPSAAAFPA